MELVGQGISELRVHHGHGYRIYFQKRGSTIIVLLCGGDKSTQVKDINAAKRLAEAWSELLGVYLQRLRCLSMQYAQGTHFTVPTREPFCSRTPGAPNQRSGGTWPEPRPRCVHTRSTVGRSLRASTSSAAAQPH
ncbi:type II toxin-antitoxin system RelE/ParE family toxin [Hydrogenophaga sp.]|uniref:type II toxin-antitoxin system RelE/ParE family toxin n=1 Tax=Hydrogenophaga sp. TaxID=1904254 RepID=UPI0025C4ED04|nr:type II toxin-antitoxin system RelE/ParE family toxin [Hydrogenophaga sp.]MDO9253260.1 hypothetical protein [Hydrogenophaga sp.]MDP2017271.1 hypothetical protein [Hydrogenophaga sp.]MDP3627938.1 hypothetical protein [Hydrogenophaga sp.]MDZ4101790.1 type II toxin-antitoxin system RelE/ParE family toxin [Hydrogenophaga sp.]MDZ4127653.1 type II toxin-antitoxin system RelE/ParE family toxin [Hydrogenophaga sp.]